MSNKPGRKPTISNQTMTLADTEYSYQLPESTVKFEVKCRTDFDVKLAFIETESSTNYFTIPSGTSYWEDEIETTKTLYFQCADAGKVLEIKSWQS